MTFVQPLQAIPDVPIEAWQQAVIVIIFSLIFIILIGLLLNWFDRQQTKWQDFIDRQNKSWQDWLTQANITTTAAMKEVAEELRNVNHKIDEHDDKVEARIAHTVEAAQRRTTTPRKRAQ